MFLKNRALFRREQHVKHVGITQCFSPLLHFSPALLPHLQASSLLAAAENRDKGMILGTSSLISKADCQVAQHKNFPRHGHFCYFLKFFFIFLSFKNTHIGSELKASRVLQDLKLLWDLAYSLNLLPSQLSYEKLVEQISNPGLQHSRLYFTYIFALFLHPVLQNFQRSLLPITVGKEKKRRILNFYAHQLFGRWWSHLDDSDSGLHRCWWCGLSGKGVKATSDPWLTLRTPTMTTVSSEKRLCGYVQSLESTSHITTGHISHQANVGADISKTVTAMKGISITLLRVILLHVTRCTFFSLNNSVCHWVWMNLWSACGKRPGDNHMVRVCKLTECLITHSTGKTI